MVAKVLDVQKHPKADRLQVVTVEAADNVNFKVALLPPQGSYRDTLNVPDLQACVPSVSPEKLSSIPAQVVTNAPNVQPGMLTVLAVRISAIRRCHTSPHPSGHLLNPGENGSV